MSRGARGGVVPVLRNMCDVCDKGEERKTGRVGRSGRMEGGLLLASSGRREADFRQQVLADRETDSQTLRERETRAPSC